MVDFPNKRVFLYSGSIDFRKGIRSLASLVETVYPNINTNEALFIFFSKDNRQVKILEIEDNNIWLYQDKLSKHKFIFPKASQTIKIDASQLKLILKTIKEIRHQK